MKSNKSIYINRNCVSCYIPNQIFADSPRSRSQNSLILSSCYSKTVELMSFWPLLCQSYKQKEQINIDSCLNINLDHWKILLREYPLVWRFRACGGLEISSPWLLKTGEGSVLQSGIYFSFAFLLKNFLQSLRVSIVDSSEKQTLLLSLIVQDLNFRAHRRRESFMQGGILWAIYFNDLILY